MHVIIGASKGFEKTDVKSEKAKNIVNNNLKIPVLLNYIDAKILKFCFRLLSNVCISI